MHNSSKQQNNKQTMHETNSDHRTNKKDRRERPTVLSGKKRKESEEQKGRLFLSKVCDIGLQSLVQYTEKKQTG
jgi:hypothetical protein